MGPEALRELLDYHYWARDRLLSAVAALSPEEFTRNLVSSFPSVRDSLVHIYSAEWIWCSRWQGHCPKAMLSPDGFADLETLASAWADHERTMRSVLESFCPDGVDRVIGYQSTAGEAFSSVFWQMLQHIVNHASYHRGQVTTLLRQLGAKPPASMDLIAFYRERLN